MSTDSWLPPDYKAPDPSGNFFKPKEGANRLRILGKPILGSVGWTGPQDARRPVRKPIGQEFASGEVTVDAKNKIRHFWALPVWNYTEKRVQVWEITQATIQAKLENLSRDSNWGAPMRYDVTVTRTGSGMDTEYETIPIPPRNPAQEIKDAWSQIRSNGFDLNRLFVGGDPFEANGANFEPTELDDPDDPGVQDEEIEADPFADGGGQAITGTAPAVEQAPVPDALSEKEEKDFLRRKFFATLGDFERIGWAEIAGVSVKAAQSPGENGSFARHKLYNALLGRDFEWDAATAEDCERLVTALRNGPTIPNVPQAPQSAPEALEISNGLRAEIDRVIANGVNLGILSKAYGAKTTAGLFAKKELITSLLWDNVEPWPALPEARRNEEVNRMAMNELSIDQWTLALERLKARLAAHGTAK